jgi:tetratricopeptide (TPR) repeat protein
VKPHTNLYGDDQHKHDLDRSDLVQKRVDIMNKKLVCVLLATIVFICLAILSWAATVPKEAQRHFDRGLAAVEMAKTPDDYEEAIEEFRKAQALAPDWADVYYNLALIQEKKALIVQNLVKKPALPSNYWKVQNLKAIH